MNENQLILSLIEPFIEPLLKKVENFDFRYFTNFQNEIKLDIENRFNDYDKNSNISDVIKEFIEKTDLRELFETIKKHNEEKRNEIIEKDIRAKLLFELLEKADNKVPNISFLILSRINPIEHIRKIYEPLDLLQDIEKYDGEHRARLAIRFFREVSEFVYDNYVRILWELTEVINNKKDISSNGKFGKLIYDLTPRLIRENSEILIEKDAGWLRNAASHASYIYNDSNDSLIIWDNNKPKKKMPVNDLLNKSIAMYTISSQTIFDIYILNIYRVILNNEIIDIIIEEKDKLLRLDNDVLKLISQRIENQFETIREINIKRK